MRIFMKDNGEGILFAAHFGGQGDVVNIGPGLKVAGISRIHFEWPIRAIAFENNNGCGHR